MSKSRCCSGVTGDSDLDFLFLTASSWALGQEVARKEVVPEAERASVQDTPSAPFLQGLLPRSPFISQSVSHSFPAQTCLICVCGEKLMPFLVMFVDVACGFNLFELYYL